MAQGMGSHDSAQPALGGGPHFHPARPSPACPSPARPVPASLLSPHKGVHKPQPPEILCFLQHLNLRPLYFLTASGAPIHRRTELGLHPTAGELHRAVFRGIACPIWPPFQPEHPSCAIPMPQVGGLGLPNVRASGDSSLRGFPRPRDL